MKKWIIGLLAAMIVTACGQQNNETTSAEAETTMEAESQETEESSEEASAEEETSKEDTDAAAEAAEEKQITGTVVDAAMNSIIIRTDDGRDLSFSKEDAETDLKDGLLLDIKVTITYTGEIDGDDATGAKVIRITDAE